MATLINNAGVQHYANKMVLAENRKVGSKSLPTALADIDNLIDEMKTNFDAEYGSALDMRLSNNTNVFSIGTGSEADKRSDVENSFTDVELSGNSLVSILSSIYTTSAEISTSYKHIGDFIPNIKPKINQTYTILPLGRSDLTFSFASLYTENGGEYGIGSLRKFGTPFSFVLTKETTDIIKFRFYLHGNSVVIPNNTTVKFMIIEGDWTNKPLPQYFEGLKSVGEKTDGNHKISISSIGKNIILDSEFKNQNGEWNRFMGEVTQGYSNNVGYTIKYSGTGDYYDVLSQKLYDCNTNQNNILPNTWYTLSFYAKGNIMRTYIYPSLIDTSVKGFVNGIETTLLGDGCYAHNLTNEWTKFTYTFKTKSQIPYRDIGHSLLFRAMPNSNCVISCLMLEQGKVATEYKPQQVNKKEISLNEPLRGLPNGTRDTIEKVNGEWKIVRRCGEVVLDGNRTWTIWSNNTDGQNLTYNAYVYSADLDITKKTTSDSNLNVINDKVTNHYRSFIDRTGESIIVASSIIHLSILRTKLETQDTTGLKKWLSQNPIKVVYELATPIIEDISPVTLQCWKNGTISIDEVLPVETTHTVALNKPAQIKRNIEELTALRKRVQALEEQYDQIALEQAHQLSLINHSIELDYNI